MKHTFLLLLFATSLFSCHCAAGAPGAVDQFIPAFKNGDAQKIGGSFDATVEISIKGKVGSYNASQATSILTDFFNANTPSNFTIEHNGSAAGSEFAIGNLTTRSGNFKVSIFVKNNGSSVVIKELRIE